MMTPCQRHTVVHGLRSGIWAIVVVAGFAASGYGLANIWSDAILLNWLHSQNHTEAAFVQELHILQSGKIAPLYDQIGNEDLNAQLHKRPILRRTHPAGPFSTANRWVARVDRSRPITVYLRMQLIQLSPKSKNRILYRPPHQSFFQVLPQNDLTPTSGKPGLYRITIPNPQSAAGFRLVVLGTHQERYMVQVDFLGNKKPFTAHP